MVWSVMGNAGLGRAMLGVLRRQSQRGAHRWTPERANPVTSSVPKPSPIRWFERVSAATSFYATFRPLFQQVCRWCTGIRFETCPQRNAAARRIHKPPRGASERRSCLGCRSHPKRNVLLSVKVEPFRKPPDGCTMTCDLHHRIAVGWGVNLLRSKLAAIGDGCRYDRQG